jgi:DNA-binding XRE family transcriptional regulator
MPKKCLSDSDFDIATAITLRKFCKKSQKPGKTIAKTIGISESSFSRMLTGKYKCSLENVILLCKFLNITVSSFIQEIEEVNKDTAQLQEFKEYARLREKLK